MDKTISSIKKHSLIISVIVVILLLLYGASLLDSASIPSFEKFHSLMVPSEHSRRMDLPQNKKLLLFVFDFDDFMCMNCLDSFLSFCHSIPPPILKENAWGILTMGSEVQEPGSKDSLSIAKTKLRGFVAANRIDFPIFIDECQIFQEFVKKGSSVLLFDGDTRVFEQYIFPLSRDQIAEILRILNES